MGTTRSEKIIMSSIYDEQQEMYSAKELSRILHSVCNDTIRQKNSRLPSDDIDTRMRRSHLSTHWPGDDIVRQIVMDTIALIRTNDLDISKIKW